LARSPSLPCSAMLGSSWGYCYKGSMPTIFRLLRTIENFTLPDKKPQEL
jgi:hypothetical protein